MIAVRQHEPVTVEHEPVVATPLPESVEPVLQTLPEAAPDDGGISPRAIAWIVIGVLGYFAMIAAAMVYAAILTARAAP